MDMNQYMEMFIEESKEHLQAINENLLELEQAPSSEIVNVVFRSAHTLKGMAATMGFEKMAHLTHEMENALDLMRNDKLPVTEDVMNVLFRCVDLLETQLADIIETGADSTASIEEAVQQLNAIVQGKPLAQAASADNPKDGSATVDWSFNQYEKTVISESLNNGKNVYVVDVVLDSACVLRAARSYMVFNAYEEIGEIIKSVPTVEDLEEEKFENEFQIVLVTDADPETVKKTGLNVSEVASVTVHSAQELQQEADKAETEAAAATQASEAPAASLSTVKNGKNGNNGKSGETKKLSAGKSVRVDIERLDVLMNLFSELVIDRTRLEQIAREINNLELVETVEHMTRVSTDLQSIVMTIRMVPVETVFNRFPRMVRDLAKELNKKVEFEIFGAETELDRTVIDEIGDPLVHMLRNALDHGLETPDERKRAGKSETGKLVLYAYHSGNHVFIEISDDGRGIDRNKILQKAIERGLVDAARGENLSDDQVFDFMFRSGFSTAEKISDVSGRGVGLDVVKNKIESLGGRVLINSVIGEGTKFIIQLPLTLSIIQAMLVQVNDEKYAIPLTSIIETANLKRSEIKSVHGQTVMDFRGRVVPLVSLEEVFSIPRLQEKTDDSENVVIVRKGEKLAALVVDSFIGQHEVVLKSLGKYLSSGIPGISGSTILGDGQVALILDCNALIH
ncbi:chemotaxis protein CheA [Effusibacillus dendaii]|uniref:Chemotaxis protein CheA n=1 Tax=Effusibacillus dendaii TaxID=2743772 RepID=A0A7I8D799_9BACL|nr:chemotaxis protein CheA [Effusibacillus dendaii]BCJ85282.1 chemotaxis protein CheA [Effusibacillus dendaii]